MSKKIILTGGGTAGHVMVNVALIPKLKEQGWNIAYIGSHQGIEREIIAKMDGVPYFPISTGKLRRYFDWNNFKDPFKVLKGTWQAYRIIKKEKPDIIFSKGGFVSVPVIIGAWLSGVPSIIHESDITPGLANKIAMPFATKICVTFPETMRHVKEEKGVYIGAVVREELKRGDADKGRKLCQFEKGKPVLLAMGGSLGSKRINDALRANLQTLLSDFQIVHICGKGNVDAKLANEKGYKQFEYVHEDLPHLLAMADIVLSRAGANSIFEFLALRKPMLLIPLSKEASRGDQILNARSFEKSGYAEVLMEEDLTNESLQSAIYHLYQNKDRYQQNMERSDAGDALEKLLTLIEGTREMK
ncbi:undecaprenyldiphospho-muramoylpentapeptide beta-N-acetylglucosaminyltransferase [Saccharococcus caldoxylosilyticus]|uniref:UDP-N-acetylglucosamine--N-acetylmuramyl-(pentapeptide) pyrophosphoryl-undecaprenol N-acetylglucosamine transferase n=1 Tax=Saccharococcus caldoxylosilyticus TaxID=81408 RepID=A0A150KWN3_9BACL|nr:undecaprenyldiphospho-muramoylpentapeptide beta-N-acetylglucosaminyltransferase [Parageobacillus caldoxylosilyticus]KYD04483.1 UDP-N-acetylglucosamine--N-acetylmuramyl-(pentapeptide) pyrophosphoryl-undecaprenol N-acetylglucosamine transferase [Parageobacillus caldoxylosilyticus]QXJ38222.1 UDP-N-acetylglucosamine--N-acetylmuramyl-(pentapeptide) pyrophosphoryl-undecaprenol N-acetylglucosamine transferase [Parageobacillus caldoxylosilyticus]BDG34313.1 UDP-N-acetylglucosamine--N-acetylmuramyl-(pe